MTGWGSGPWGSTPWGEGAPLETLTPAAITPLDPLENASGVPASSHISIRFTDDLQVLGDSITIAVNGLHYVIGGVPQLGANFISTPNAENGFDTELDIPQDFDLGSTQEVFVTCLDSSGYLSVLTYYFTVGVGLRLLAVSNPRDKTLVAHFNKPVARNQDFFFTGNWVVTRIDAEEVIPLEIIAVNGNPTNPQNAVLRYSGGDAGTYQLRVVSIVSQAGEPIEPGWDTAEFVLVFEEEAAPTVRLFDSVFGPVGVSQQIRTKRTMDDHCAKRALALALDEQVTIRKASLDSTASRDGRPGARRQ